MAGLAVGWQQWASQETNLREKTIGLFKRCTDEKSGGETCDSISAIDCQTESDPDKCDEMVTFLTAISILMIIGAVLAVASSVFSFPRIQMYAISCIIGILSGVTFLVSIVMFAVMDRTFGAFFKKDACFSTSFGCAIAALTLVWCGSVVAGIATRREEDDDY